MFDAALEALLHHHLDDPEFNVRALDRLSQALCRHSIAVSNALDHRWADPDKALSLLSSYGYSVVNVAEILEDKAREKARLDTPPPPPKQ